jgi:hypothetical protein
MSRLIALPVLVASLIAVSAVLAQTPGQMPGTLPNLPPALPQVIPPPPPVAPPPVAPSVSGQPIQGLSPRSTYVPYAGTSTLRYTATPKRSKKRFRHKRRIPRVSDIVIIRQI